MDADKQITARESRSRMTDITSKFRISNLKWKRNIALFMSLPSDSPRYHVITFFKFRHHQSSLIFPPTNLQSFPGPASNPSYHSKITKACLSIPLQTLKACPPKLCVPHSLSFSKTSLLYDSFSFHIISLSHLTQSSELIFKHVLILLAYIFLFHGFFIHFFFLF